MLFHLDNLRRNKSHRTSEATNAYQVTSKDQWYGCYMQIKDKRPNKMQLLRVTNLREFLRRGDRGTKVGDLEDHPFTDQDVSRVQIPMNDFVPMNRPYALDNLFPEVADFGFGQELAFGHQRRQVLGKTEFLSKIHPVRVIGHAKVLDHVAVTPEFFQMLNFMLDLYCWSLICE